MKKLSLLALSLSGIIAPSFAQAAEKEYSLQIDRQPLVATLRELSRQTGLQVVGILGAEGEAEGRIVGPLRGDYTAEAALNELLAKSDLIFRRVNERTIAILARSSTEPGWQVDTSENNTLLPLSGTAMPSAVRPKWLPIGTTDSEAVRHEEGHTSASVGNAGRVAGTDQATPPDAPWVEHVTVVGTHIRGAAPAGSNHLVMDREQLATSGYGRVQDVLETLPQNFGGISEDFSQDFTANTTQGTEIQLRGLGPGTTLTLINGQRQPAGGVLGAFTDISSIPVSAIERIEILPDGASAIYGSDAIGGVVNIILRQDYEGSETSMRLASAGGEADEVQVGHVVGTHWTTGHILGGYQYYQRDPLKYGDRKYLATGGDQRQFGGTDWRRSLRGANPGNILNSAGQVAYAIPQGQDGTNLSVGDLLPGQTNYFDSSRLTILPEQEIHSVFLSASQSLGDRVDLDFSGRYAERDSVIDIGASSLATVTVPATNPFNPFPNAVSVEYDFSDDLGGPSADHGRTETFTGNLAATVDLGADWRLKVSAAHGEESVEHFRTNLRDTAATTAALADTNPATALNVFGDGSNTNPQTLARLRTDRFDRSTSTISSTSAIADGPLFRLPGGMARLAIGSDYREEGLDLTSNYEISLPSFAPGKTQSNRDVLAVFSELSLPLLSSSSSRSTRPRLELSLAGRFDDYDEFGSTFNPRIGANWMVFETVRLRGTWGTSFRAPPFYLSNGDVRIPRASTATLADPTSPTGRSVVLAVTGVVPDLQEETAAVWTAGIDFVPSGAFSGSLTYFHIDYEDKIEGPGSPATLLAFENQFAGTGVITRNPTPEQISAICSQPFATCNRPFTTIVDARLRNISSVKVDGLDLSASYAFQMRAAGTLSVGLGGTYTFNHERAVTEAAPKIDYVDTLESPLAVRVRGTLSWTLGRWLANAAVNYADSYDNPNTSPSTKIDSWTTVDVGAGYELPENLGWAANTRLLLAATNVFDKAPPFVDQIVGYDTANGNVLGRAVSFQVHKKW